METNPFSLYFRLESRVITYSEGNKAEPKRAVKDIVETYSRNYNIPAKQDVWKKIFHIQENTIELLYHYAYNFVTNNTRSYIKPNLAETGGKILFYPDKTAGYIVSENIFDASKVIDFTQFLIEKSAHSNH